MKKWRGFFRESWDYADGGSLSFWLGLPRAFCRYCWFTFKDKRRVTWRSGLPQ
jgi:hypothetical protein